MAVTAALATSVAIPAVAARSTRMQVLWARYDFRGAGNGQLVLEGTARIGVGSYIADADVMTYSGGMSTSGHVFDVTNIEDSRTYGALGNRDLCAGPLTCSWQGGKFGFGMDSQVFGDGHHFLHIRVYIAIAGEDVHLHDKLLDGWTAHHRSGGVTRVTDESAGGGGVQAGGQTLGVNTGATAAGPDGGSVAIAVPGCDDVGAGVLTLTGGATSTTALCPSDAIVGISNRPTTWVASGAVAGASENTTRLVVLRA